MPLDQMSDEKEMSFLDHLEELRWHVVRASFVVALFTIMAFIMKDFFFGVLILGPTKVDFPTYQFLCSFSEWLKIDVLCIKSIPFTLQSRQMMGQFTMHLSSSIFIGIVTAFPYVFWEIWRFVKPGLRLSEIRVARGATFFVSVLFFIGIFFGYYIVTPISINFLGNYQLDSSIVNEFDIVSYVSTVITLVFGCGLLFQLPIVTYFLAKTSVVSSQFLKKYRKHAIVGILIIAAVVTPPDPFSQILVTIPLVILYEFSIFIARYVERKEMKKIND